MSDDPDNSNNNTVNNNTIIPTYPDKTPILYYGNPATMDGCLHEAGEFFARNGTFSMFDEHHAVAMSNGKLAVDSVQALLFIMGTHSDPHSFADPCPPTQARLTKYAATPGSTALT
jgi:hypothetical protein